MTAAVQTGRRVHPTSVPSETLVGQFWERFTGGDIACAPDPIAIKLSSPKYQAYRRVLGVPHADLFHVAHRHLCASTGVDGPLTLAPWPAARTDPRRKPRRG